MEGAGPGVLICVSHHPLHNSVQEASPTSATVSSSVKSSFSRILEEMAMMGWAIKDRKQCMQGAEVVVRSLE